MYQDVWVNGKVIKPGERECENRYNIISKYCEKDFSVLDIGANMSYFGLRLIEDFDCNVMAFEFNNFEERFKIIKQNKTEKLLFLNRKISLEDLNILKTFCHFDLVLALSVLHHIRQKELAEWIKILRSISKKLIVEFALSDSARVKNYFIIPEGGQIIGYGLSHLKKDFKRPIYLYESINAI